MPLPDVLRDRLLPARAVLGSRPLPGMENEQQPELRRPEPTFRMVKRGSFACSACATDKGPTCFIRTATPRSAIVICGRCLARAVAAIEEAVPVLASAEEPPE